MAEPIEITHQEIRKQHGKNAYCSVGIITSSNVRMNATSEHSKGFDDNKKIKGLKRHAIVSSLGLVINVATHSANIHG